MWCPGMDAPLFNQNRKRGDSFHFTGVYTNIRVLHVGMRSTYSSAIISWLIQSVWKTWPQKVDVKSGCEKRSSRQMGHSDVGAAAICLQYPRNEITLGKFTNRHGVRSVSEYSSIKSCASGWTERSSSFEDHLNNLELNKACRPAPGESHTQRSPAWILSELTGYIVAT